jgi:hypothetical protein
MLRLLPWVLLLSVACAPNSNLIPGTDVPRGEFNESILRRVEEYRLAVEKKDIRKLLLMAAPDYWEDGGTAAGDDDYGYKKLRTILEKEFQEADDIRYSLRYVKVERKGNRAYVDVLIDASFSMIDAQGHEMRKDKRDQNQLILRWNPKKEQWMFLSGY